jgi:thiamine-phosphate pyrophosphorylase
MTKPAFDLRLYLVVGRSDCAGRPLAEVVEAAVAGGVTLVQLREKELPSAELASLARELLAVLRPRGVPLIVNDDLEGALASGADGLHVGQEDLAAGEARRRLGADKILGLSISNDAEAHAVDPRVVDYLGIGPVYPTPTKTDAAPALGPLGTARLRRRWPALPACAIGGIKAANVAEVMAPGVAGLSVVSAIAGAADPRAAAEELRSAMLRARPG